MYFKKGINKEGLGNIPSQCMDNHNVDPTDKSFCILPQPSIDGISTNISGAKTILRLKGDLYDSVNNVWKDESGQGNNFLSKPEYCPFYNPNKFLDFNNNQFLYCLNPKFNIGTDSFALFILCKFTKIKECTIFSRGVHGQFDYGKISIYMDSTGNVHMNLYDINIVDNVIDKSKIKLNSWHLLELIYNRNNNDLENPSCYGIDGDMTNFTTNHATGNGPISTLTPAVNYSMCIGSSNDTYGNTVEDRPVETVWYENSPNWGPNDIIKVEKLIEEKLDLKKVFGNKAIVVEYEPFNQVYVVIPGGSRAEGISFKDPSFTKNKIKAQMFIAGGGGAGGSVNPGGDEGGGGGGGGSFGFGTIEFDDSVIYHFLAGRGGPIISNSPFPGGDSIILSGDMSFVEFYPGGGAGGSGQGGKTSPGVVEMFDAMFQSLNEGFQDLTEGYRGSRGKMNRPPPDQQKGAPPPVQQNSAEIITKTKKPFHGGGGGNGWGTKWEGAPGTNLETISSVLTREAPSFNTYPNINRQYTKAGGDGKHEEGGGGGGGAIGPGEASSGANNGMYGAGFLIPDLKRIIETANIDANELKTNLKRFGYSYPIPDDITELFAFCKGGFGGKGRTTPSNRDSIKMIGDGGNGGDSHGGEGSNGMPGIIILIFNKNDLINSKTVIQTRNPNPNPTPQEIDEHKVKKTKVEMVHSLPSSDEYFSGGIYEMIAYTSPTNFTKQMRFQIEDYFLRTYKLYAIPSFKQMILNNTVLSNEMNKLNIGSTETGFIGPDINNNMQISYNGVATGSEFHVNDTGDSIIAKYNPEILKKNCKATSDWLKSIHINWNAITSDNACNTLSNV